MSVNKIQAVGRPNEDGSALYAVARKYSVSIAGHETSIRLEPVFWEALVDAAAERAIPVNALIAQIDVARIANHPPPNLASAIRQWLLLRAIRLGQAARPV